VPAWLQASVSLALNAALDYETRLANTQRRSFKLRVCIQSYDVSHSLSDVLTRDFGTRESSSAC